MIDWIASLSTFLLVTATGAAGGYFALKHTDLRRKKESSAKIKSDFHKIKGLMAQLISEIKGDLSNPEFCVVREFVILPNERVIFSKSQKRFVYFEDLHDDLQNKITMLENHGYIIDITPGNTPIYLMTEEFVKLVLETEL